MHRVNCTYKAVLRPSQENTFAITLGYRQIHYRIHAFIISQKIIMSEHTAKELVSVLSME